MSAGVRARARARGLAVALCGVWLLTGCATGAFYAQAVGGHLNVMARAQPLEVALEAPDTPSRTKERLRLAQRIRDFASEALALPDNGSYRAYARLGRGAVVWNVFAAPEFSVEARRWCYPVAGCVIYRGYFDRGAAEAEARRLREGEGLQTWIGAVPAYSTLGWMDDPLLDTFIDWPEAELAGLIFHELAHQVVWVRGDTAFNESFAVAVELEGVRRWMDARGDPQAAAAYEQRRAAQELRRARLLEHRAQLQRLYASAQSPQAMREQRGQMEQSLLHDLRTPGPPGAVPAQAPNNAQLAAIAAYAAHVPAFQALLGCVGGDLPAFHRVAAGLARLPSDERARRLIALAAVAPPRGSGCAAAAVPSGGIRGRRTPSDNGSGAAVSGGGVLGRAPRCGHGSPGSCSGLAGTEAHAIRADSGAGAAAALDVRGEGRRAGSRPRATDSLRSSRLHLLVMGVDGRCR